LENSRSYFSRKNIFFLVKLISLGVACEFLFSILYEYNGIELVNPLTKMPLFVDAIVSIIISPLFETWLVQYLPFKVIYKWDLINEKKRDIVCVTASVVLFASLHHYSIWYVLFALVPGAMLGYCFFHFYKFYGSLSVAFWFTATVHSIINIISILYDYLL
jgi:hypothetical protein